MFGGLGSPLGGHIRVVRFFYYRPNVKKHHTPLLCNTVASSRC